MEGFDSKVPDKEGAGLQGSDFIDPSISGDTPAKSTEPLWKGNFEFQTLSTPHVEFPKREGFVTTGPQVQNLEDSTPT